MMAFVVVFAVPFVKSLMTPLFVSVMMRSSPGMATVLRAVVADAVSASVEMSMVSAVPFSPTIGIVITVSIVSVDDMLDQIALVIERCGEIGLAGQCGEGGQEIEVIVDDLATMTVMTVVGRGAACEEEGGQGRGPDCPDLPTHSFRRIHQFFPPSFVSPNSFVWSGVPGSFTGVPFRRGM